MDQKLAVMQVILAAVVPVLITILIGYALAKAKQPFDGKTIGFLVGTIGTPVLVFTSLAKTTVEPVILGTIMLATLCAIASYLVISATVLTLSGLPLRTYLPSLSFPNTGNLGLPLAFYAFGQDGLNYAVAIFAVNSVCNHTLGQSIAAGRGQWRTVLQSFIVPAALLGIVFGTVRIPLPIWLDNTLTLMTGLTIPLMLLMLGTSLAKIPVTSFPRATGLSILRIGMGTGVGFLISALFGFTGAERGAFVLQSAMPVAIYSYMYAQLYNNAPEDIASLVVVSTVLSVVTIPPLLAFLAA